MKTINLVCALAVLFTFQIQAQSVSGSLSLNGKSKTEIKLESNSVVQLFKEFKTGKYQLKFNFKADGVPENIYKETIVLFEFRTEIYKDGKLVKNLVRKQPIPYFPGDMDLPAEAFDFIGLFTVTSWDDMERNPEMLGVIPEGNYSVKLYANPVGLKGEIKPLNFNFALRKRPGRAKY
jgi:hypothetical protein